MEWNNLHATYFSKGVSFVNNTRSAPPSSEIFLYSDYLCIFQQAVIWTDSDLHLKMSSKPLDALVFFFRFTVFSKYFVESTIKANKIGPDTHDLDALAGKCINNRTRGISKKGAELIVYFF